MHFIYIIIRRESIDVTRPQNSEHALQLHDHKKRFYWGLNNHPIWETPKKTCDQFCKKICPTTNLFFNSKVHVAFGEVPMVLYLPSFTFTTNVNLKILSRCKTIRCFDGVIYAFVSRNTFRKRIKKEKTKPINNLKKKTETKSQKRGHGNTS